MVSLYNANDMCKIINIAVSSSARRDERLMMRRKKSLKHNHSTNRSTSKWRLKSVVIKWQTIGGQTHTLPIMTSLQLRANKLLFIPTSVVPVTNSTTFWQKVIKLISPAGPVCEVKLHCILHICKCHPRERQTMPQINRQTGKASEQHTATGITLLHHHFIHRRAAPAVP